MLISAARLPLEGNFLRLFEWIRAPLFLSEGTRYYAALENDPPGTQSIELVISAFDHQLWGDLWRIEIDTDDVPGNSAILFSLLEARGFEILCAESSVNTFSTNHSTSVIVSAHSYFGEQDLSQKERYRQDRPELNELRREISAYLGDKIAFNPDGAPAFKVAHFRAYRRLSNELHNGSRFILNRSGDLIKEGGIQLTPRAISHVTKVIGENAVHYMPAVETRDRLIRVIFINDDQPKTNYFQMIVQNEPGALLSSTYRLLFETGANIVRNQVRPCPDWIAQERVNRATGQGLFLDQLPRFVTVDVTFNFPGVSTKKGWEKKIALLEAGIKKLSDQNAGKCFVVKESWRSVNAGPRHKNTSTKRNSLRLANPPSTGFKEQP
jgi:hypothetical protein